jgi:hypothetical protein
MPPRCTTLGLQPAVDNVMVQGSRAVLQVGTGPGIQSTPGGSMKFQPATLAAAVALAFAGPASAAITLGDAQGGSSLILSVWDDARSVSYTRNLGTNLNGFLPSSITTLPNDGNVVGTPVTGDKTPDAGLTLSFPGDPLFASTFAGSTPANVQWNIVAFDNQASIGGGLSRVLTTAPATPGTTNAGIGTISAGITQYLNSLLQQTNIGAAGVNSVSWNDPSVFAYAGNPNFGPGLNGNALNGTSVSTLGGDPLFFFYLARTQVSGLNSTPATNIQFQNGAGFATWSLALDGTATYNLSPVPLPPALWLMASGLVAVLGFARRRRAAV